MKIFHTCLWCLRFWLEFYWKVITGREYVWLIFIVLFHSLCISLFLPSFFIELVSKITDNIPLNSLKYIWILMTFNPHIDTIHVSVSEVNTFFSIKGPVVSFMEKDMAIQYFCLENPMEEEPGRLQSMGSLRVRHDWAASLSLFTFMHWRRKCQPTPVFLPRESQGQGSLLGCRLWSRTWLKRLSSSSRSDLRFIDHS